ncbi:OmpA/MotB domain protein [Cellulomonas flavigena DSM 20109]|uniref:OmpA/MotB domain protein n=1 Tax=Cellulomonas flavigena (strain ATCC 482 / DSM 20109 / BCRC 11376 / JCM 18109 / NBRC 3775 / NCIMB 8073 / NRS 134) TaxID=446466 RepID=D5UIA3_CELFN|nr:OmpA family protein [Cellulomonas flavigena]ADG75448.1 OmpA/MotB domain protein [Cellulomonas flavigena DSM 20109]
MRLRRSGAALAALTLLGLGAGSAAAGTTGDDVELGVATVEAQEVPVHAFFAYNARQDDTKAEVRGVVHGVRRVEGGTALYYSIGSPGPDSVRGAGMFLQAKDHDDIPYAWDVKLVDATNLRAYRPLRTSEGLATSVSSDLTSEGDLHVAFAVFPELPDDVTEVQVVLANGTSAGAVPVEDGALEPVADEPAPRPGQGWPALPDPELLATADPEERTFVLTRRSSDLAGDVQVEESPEQVGIVLDASVLFAFDSAELAPEAQSRLAEVAADIAARGTGEVVVTGYTDSDGDRSYNQTLSEQRAQSVVAALQPAAGGAVTFSAVGEGESDPVASNDTDEGKQANRRVTIVYSVEGDR